MQLKDVWGRGGQGILEVTGNALEVAGVVVIRHQVYGHSAGTLGLPWGMQPLTSVSHYLYFGVEGT